jgi:hypothetical protein
MGRIHGCPYNPETVKVVHAVTIIHVFIGVANAVVGAIIKTAVKITKKAKWRQTRVDDEDKV